MVKEGYYIDIHSHILPQVDDGAKNWEISKEMLRAAYEERIRVIIATPHYRPHQEVKLEHLHKLQKQLQEEASQIDSEFLILLGNEIYYESGCLEALKKGQALTLANTRYVLIEFSISESFSVIYDALNNLIINGYLPILAHMERYECLYKRIDRIQQLIQLGCYLQVNVNSLKGSLWNARTRFLRKLINQQLIHLLATDAHNMSDRKPRMKNIMNQVSKKNSRALFESLVSTNPSLIIQNKYI